MNTNLAKGLLLVSLCVGIGIGYAFTPEYADAMDRRDSGMIELGRADQSLDLRYIDGMIAHHLSAVYMSRQAIDLSKRKEISDTARAIISADEKSMEMLYAWKKQWYNNSRRITKYPQVHLGRYDDTFDLRFLNAMIGHHDEAIDIAKEVRTKSTRTEILSLADSVITELTQSKLHLFAWRTSWYGF